MRRLSLAGHPNGRGASAAILAEQIPFSCPVTLGHQGSRRWS